MSVGTPEEEHMSSEELLNSGKSSQFSTFHINIRVSEFFIQEANCKLRMLLHQFSVIFQNKVKLVELCI
jgi:hypothetical protein